MSIASNFCCDETELSRLHAPDTLITSFWIDFRIKSFLGFFFKQKVVSQITGQGTQMCFIWLRYYSLDFCKSVF